MHTENIIFAGRELRKEGKVLILVHGRGGSAGDILSLANHLNLQDYTLLAPQATNNTWYPFSFLETPKQNEPWLSSALTQLKNINDNLEAKGVLAENIFFSGFSQGACLVLEYISRYARQYGGIAAFSGGLIGDRIYRENYKGDFKGTPVFLGTSNPDPHIPVQRVYATANILREMNAEVTEKIYENMGHTISQDEID